MLRISTIVCVVLASVLSSSAYAGFLGSGSISSHSGSTTPNTAKVSRTIKVGALTVELPDNDTKLKQLNADSAVWTYHGNQTILQGNPTDAGMQEELIAFGTAEILIGNTTDWDFKFGDNGNCLLYVATNKANSKLHVAGSAQDVDDIKRVLNNIKLVTEVKTEAKEVKK